MDIEDGGRFIAEMDIGFHLREVGGGGIHLAVFEAEALEPIGETVSPRSLQVIGKVVVVGEQVAAAFVLEEGRQFSLGFVVGGGDR